MREEADLQRQLTAAVEDRQLVVLVEPCGGDDDPVGAMEGDGVREVVETAQDGEAGRAGAARRGNHADRLEAVFGMRTHLPDQDVGHGVLSDEQYPFAPEHAGGNAPDGEPQQQGGEEHEAPQHHDLREDQLVPGDELVEDPQHEHPHEDRVEDPRDVVDRAVADADLQ